MLNIAGWCRDESPNALERLATLGRMLTNGRSLPVGRWSQAGVSLVWAEDVTDQSCEVSRQGERTLFVCGTLYNLDEVFEQRVGASIRHGARRSDALLALFEAGGAASLAGLNGAFVIGIWDERERCLRLMTDRLGLQRLYYAQTAGTLRFASQVKVLLAHAEVKRTLDLSGLAHTLTIGHLLDDRTLYEDIRLLQGGVWLEYHAEQARLRLTRYWAPRYATRNHSASLVECADELARRLEVAVERQIRSARHLGITLSGGLDSRTLLGFARKLHPHDELQTFTVGHRRAYDVAFARRLAGVCRTFHHETILAAEHLARNAELCVSLTEGMGGILGTWALDLSSEASHRCDHLLLGFLGGTLTGKGLHADISWNALNPPDLAHRAFQAYRAAFADEELKRLVRPRVYEAIKDLARQDFTRSVEAAEADEPIDRLLIAELLQRQQRWISNKLIVFGAYLPVSAPFADNDVVDFQMTVPLRYRQARGAYKDMILRHLPDLARVGYSRTGLPLKTGWAQRVVHASRERLQEVWPSTWGGCQPATRRAKIDKKAWIGQAAIRLFVEQTVVHGAGYLEDWCDVNEARRILLSTGDHPVWRTAMKTDVLLRLILWFRQVDGSTPVRCGSTAEAAAR